MSLYMDALIHIQNGFIYIGERSTTICIENIFDSFRIYNYININCCILMLDREYNRMSSNSKRRWMVASQLASYGQIFLFECSSANPPLFLPGDTADVHWIFMVHKLRASSRELVRSSEALSDSLSFTSSSISTLVLQRWKRALFLLDSFAS